MKVGLDKKIQTIIDNIPTDNKKEIILELEAGIYNQRVIINKPNITLQGISREQTIISMGYYGYEKISEDEAELDEWDKSIDVDPNTGEKLTKIHKRGTFRSYTCMIDAPNVTLKNLTIENSTPDSKNHGQAIALYDDGDNTRCENIALKSHQDTLFIAPLPEAVVEPRGFIGPKEFAPRKAGVHYYKNCYICGDIDFIFGGGTAYFEGCEIESLSRKNGEEYLEEQGYITAASTREDLKEGFVFTNCRLISKDCPKGSVYLGRPWRENAKTEFINCQLGEHIHPDRWQEWNGRIRMGGVRYIVR